MIKFSILLCVAVVFTFAATPAARGARVPSASRWDPDETAPTEHDVASAAAQARATHCRTSSCKAIIIHEIVDIVLYQNNDGNGVPMLGNRPKIAGRRLDRTLLDHPKLYGPICAMGVKLVSRVHPDGDIFIPIVLLMHGVDMDLRDHGHCARDLVVALPSNPASDQIRINARDLCVDEDHHPKAACAVLVEGVKEKQ